MNSPTPPKESKLSFENPPLEVRDYFVGNNRVFDWPKWYLSVMDSTGIRGTLYIENDPISLSAYTEKFDGDRINKESLFYHGFPDGRRWVRHCAIPELLGDFLIFPPQLLLAWALLDIDVDATAIALAAGADLFRPVLEDYYAMDLLSLAVASRLQSALRFYLGDERDPIQSMAAQSIDGSDHVARAVRIRSMLLEAGAQDIAPLRNAIKNGDFHLAKARLLTGVPLDAQSPDGLTPLLTAIFSKNLRALRWLIHEGADCSMHPDVPDWLGMEPPESFSAMWSNASRISPLAAACAADSPEAFGILLDEAACHFSDSDYQQIIKHSKAPAWAKDALLAGGFTNLPEPIQLSERDARLMKLLEKDECDAPRKPEAFRAVFLNNLASRQAAVDWAEQHAPELLDPPADDPLARERLVRRWLEATGADPSPLLIDAVDANNPSLVELLLPADPDTMGHALLLAMTHANRLTQDCYDFCLYRGCITDDIRGKGLPEGYLEVAGSIVTLLRNHGSRDFTLLARAARDGDLEKMRTEIEGGTPPNFTCDGWGSPLLAAIVGSHLAAVEYLLAAGADLNLGFDPGILNSFDRNYLELPLVTAARLVNPAILKFLIKAGADLHCPQMEKSRLFESGTLSREMAEILFESPLPLLRNEEGSTCAHLLDEEPLRLCQDLIPAAAWNARNKAGHTPLMDSITHNSPIVSFLLTAGASPDGYSGVAGFLWAQSLPSKGRVIALTPLHAAIAAHDIVLVETLLDAGADLDLPAFYLAENRSMESCQRLRDVLDHFQPADLPRWKRETWRPSFEEEQEWNLRFDDVASSPCFTEDELNLPRHYLAEDPSRASQNRDLITALSCRDLAECMDSPLIMEIINDGGKLPAVSFFSHMRDEISRKISEYREILRDLEDPGLRKPLVYPYMKEMRQLEVTVLHRIWEETGTLPATRINRDAAMECLRFATAEFFDGFVTAIEHVEETGEASMEHLGSVLAENLNPGSTIDLGKFFSNALANLRRLDELCDRN